MKAKYDQSIDADSIGSGIVERAKKHAISDEDKEKITDIVIASRKADMLPQLVKRDEKVAGKISNKITTGKANILANNDRAQNLLGKIADMTISSDNRKTVSEVIEYRKSKKDKKKSRK